MRCSRCDKEKPTGKRCKACAINRQQEYRRTAKGKESAQRYWQSKKGKDTMRRYWQSRKGKNTMQRARLKKLVRPDAVEQWATETERYAEEREQVDYQMLVSLKDE